MSDEPKTTAYPKWLPYLFWTFVLLALMGGCIVWIHTLSGAVMMSVGSMGAALSLLRGQDLNNAN